MQASIARRCRAAGRGWSCSPPRSRCWAFPVARLTRDAAFHQAPCEKCLGQGGDLICAKWKDGHRISEPLRSDWLNQSGSACERADAHANGRKARCKVHLITRSKTYGLTAFGYHGDIPLQQQAGFPPAIAPRKSARLAVPDRPSLHAQVIQLRRVRSVDHSDQGVNQKVAHSGASFSMARSCMRSINRSISVSSSGSGLMCLTTIR